MLDVRLGSRIHGLVAHRNQGRQRRDVQNAGRRVSAQVGKQSVGQHRGGEHVELHYGVYVLQGHLVEFPAASCPRIVNEGRQPEASVDLRHEAQEAVPVGQVEFEAFAPHAIAPALVTHFMEILAWESHQQGVLPPGSQLQRQLPAQSLARAGYQSIFLFHKFLI